MSLKHLLKILGSAATAVFLAACQNGQAAALPVSVYPVEEIGLGSRIDFEYENEAVPEVEEQVFNLLDPPIKSAHGRYVYLTFDDGPSHNTEQILDILAEFDVQGTFFVLGNSILSRNDSREILNRALREGHYIGLHSMTHEHARLYQGPGAPEIFLDEMKEVQSLIYELTGHSSYLCRAPFGSRPTFSQQHVDLIAQSPFSCWDWHIDTMDWSHRSVEAIMLEIQQNMASLQDPNQIVVLMHENQVTVEALPSIIKFFRDLGYTFVAYHPDNHFPVNFHNNPDL